MGAEWFVAPTSLCLPLLLAVESSQPLQLHHAQLAALEPFEQQLHSLSAPYVPGVLAAGSQGSFSIARLSQGHVPENAQYSRCSREVRRCYQRQYAVSIPMIAINRSTLARRY